MAEEKRIASGHSLVMEERQRLTVNGVTDIERFDEEEVVVSTQLGQLSIRGFGLKLNKIDVENGELSVEGEIGALSYAEERPGAKGSLWSRLLR